MDRAALVLDARARHPGMLLLFRHDDSYEAFDEDAEVLRDCCGTATIPGNGDCFLVARFQYHALETILRKLLAAGHRVAICEQLPDEAATKRGPHRPGWLF